MLVEAWALELAAVVGVVVVVVVLPPRAAALVPQVLVGRPLQEVAPLGLRLAFLVLALLAQGLQVQGLQLLP